MKNIMLLHKRSLLTDRQVLMAHMFNKNPNRFRLAPSLHRILHSVIILQEPLEAMEKRLGLPARSAKALVGILLHSLLEIGGSHDEQEDIENLREQIHYVTGDSLMDLMPLMQRYNLTPIQARILLILQRAPMGRASKQAIYDRLYADKPNELPDLKIIDVNMVVIRKKLKGTSLKIQTVWGAGFQLIEAAEIPDLSLKWYVQNVLQGKSFRRIAAENDTHASTVLRQINKLVSHVDDEQLSRAAQEFLQQKATVK